ncbi:hypothetical protein BKA65DRAFT_471968 [Rhexocercosporidium sp. MPI-PUGE-AT-0058]|nr:hypothetical protein BKA65DRAFT_471968 [Rhexocercosporidium sp. MPI-PUGE-AT-0058]
MRGRISESFNEIVGTSFSAVRIQDSRTRPEGSSPDDANRHGLNQIWITCDSLNQELRMYATSVRTSSKWRIPRPMNIDSGSEHSIQLVRNWVSTCSKKHKCKVEESPLPTRVIDVGLSEDSYDPKLYPLLGLSTYVQDDTGDIVGNVPVYTTKVAAKDISGHSASGSPNWHSLPAKDGQEGFFNRRQPSQDAPPGHVFGNAGTLVKVFRGAHASRSAFGNDYDGEDYCVQAFDRRGIKGPIDTRAWTLQEEALSGRILRYNRTHMTWHCSEWSEMHENGRQIYRIGTWHRLPSMLASAESKRIPHIWHSIVADYTKRHMTFCRDKLPALAGVVMEFQRHTSDQYLAGIWKTHLPLALLWRSESYWAPRGYPEQKRPAEYRAPSWSWACVDGEVDFQLCTSNLPCEPGVGIEFMDTYIRPVGGSLGSVTDGHLIIHGRLKNGSVGDKLELGHYKSTYDTELLSASEQSLEPVSIGKCAFDVMSDRLPYRSEIWCLQISLLQGLMLVPSENGVSFKRIGLFVLADEGAWFRGCPTTEITLK